MSRTATTTNTPLHAFDNLFRTRKGADGRVEDLKKTVIIPFHGSCARCHHFHKSYPFTLHLDPTKHKRLSCQRCNHQMFGLGRVSTQSTLASVESGFTPNARNCVDPPEPQLQLEPNLGPSSPTPVLLTTIVERKSPAISRSTSNIRDAAPSPTALTVNSDTEASFNPAHHTEILSGPEDVAQGIPQAPGHIRQPITLKRLLAVGHRFRKRFRPKPREWQWSLLGLRFIIEPSSDLDEGSPVPGMHNPERTTMDVPQSTGGDNLPTFSANSRTPGTDPEYTVHESSISASAPDTLFNHSVNNVKRQVNDRHASLRTRRRRLTLEREAALRSNCECNRGCYCIKDSNVGQVDSADFPSIDVPGYVVGPESSTGSSGSQSLQQEARRLQFLHMGVHFDSSPKSSSAEESSSVADSSSRRIRLSRVPTFGSDGSSLRGRRPPVDRAVSLPLVLPPQHRVRARTASQNTNAPDHGATSFGNFEMRGQPCDGEITNGICHINPSQEVGDREINDVPLPANPTSLVYPPRRASIDGPALHDREARGLHSPDQGRGDNSPRPGDHYYPGIASSRPSEHGSDGI